MLVQVPVQVVEFWESLFLDDSGKDVELKARDGSVWAHTLILAQMSEPIKSMLNAGMAEQRTKTIQMKSFSTAHLRFILRFVYTGHIEPADWDGGAARSRPGVGRKLPAAPRKKLGPLSRSGGRGCTSAASAESLAPPTASLAAGRLRRRTGSSLGSLAPVAVIAGSAKASSDRSESSEGDSDDEDICGVVPLDLLLGGLSFAKQYQMPGLVNVILDYIRIRLTQGNFEKVMQRAIAIDMSPLKLMCLKHAERNGKIKQAFDRGELSPEVMFELHALWTPPRSKKARLSLI